MDSKPIHIIVRAYIEKIITALAGDHLAQGREVYDSFSEYDLSFDDRKKLASSLLDELFKRHLVFGEEFWLERNDWWPRSPYSLLKDISMFYASDESTQEKMFYKATYRVSSNDPAFVLIHSNIERLKKHIVVNPPSDEVDSIIAFEKAKLKQYLRMAERGIRVYP